MLHCIMLNSKSKRNHSRLSRYCSLNASARKKAATTMNTNKHVAVHLWTADLLLLECQVHDVLVFFAVVISPPLHSGHETI